MSDTAQDTVKLNLRLPKHLHLRLQKDAKQNNMSLNTEIINELDGRIMPNAQNQYPQTSHGLQGQQAQSGTMMTWPPFTLQAQQHNHYVCISPADRALIERLVVALEARAPKKKQKR